MTNQTILSCSHLKKSFHDGESSTHVLADVNLTVQEHQSIAIIGASGSGKTTLLQLLGGLDRASSGVVEILGQPVADMSTQAVAKIRNQQLGFIYQFHHLLPEFTALENVAMPLLINQRSEDESQQQAEAILKKVGLSHRLTHKPSQLSGGERQRVAIARALVNNPSCVLADEPTGNLDRHTAAEVFELILSIKRDSKTAFVIVTHDLDIASQLDVQYELVDGRLSPAS